MHAPLRILVLDDAEQKMKHVCAQLTRYPEVDVRHTTTNSDAFMAAQSHVQIAIINVNAGIASIMNYDPCRHLVRDLHSPLYYAERLEDSMGAKIIFCRPDDEQGRVFVPLIPGTGPRRKPIVRPSAVAILPASKVLKAVLELWPHMQKHGAPPLHKGFVRSKNIHPEMCRHPTFDYPPLVIEAAMRTETCLLFERFKAGREAARRG